MNVTFTKTGERRYRVLVEGPGVVSSYMEPAAGYDYKLPHDMAHFVVENMFGIMGCVFGPLSQGGNGFTPLNEAKKRKAPKRGNPSRSLNQKEAEMAERAIDIACHVWTDRPYTGAPVKGISPEDIKRICREFDAVSSVWSKLAVGGSMTLVWSGGSKASSKRG